jgi:sugar (pentulose or hexulose) kinase
MSREPLVIGVDASTHGTKAIAWSLRGEAIAEGRAGVALVNPQPGWWEQRAEEWGEATTAALAEVGAQVGSRVSAIGLTHQRETFVGVDNAWQSVRPAIVWMDERAHAEVAQIRAAFGEDRFHELTGKPLSMTPSVSKIKWLHSHEPAEFDSARRWLDVGGYLVHALTGEDATSVASAEAMGLVDLRAGSWNDELLALAGLDASRVSRLIPAGQVAGTLIPHVSSATSLPDHLPVVVTAGDGQAAALGAQILGLDRAYLNLGTAVVAGTVAPDFRINRAYRTMGGALPGTYLLESDLKGGTFTIDWLRDTVLGGRVSIDDLERRAAAVPPGAAGLVLVPYLATVMDPYWDDDASGILVGLRGEHGPGHLMRAAMEGLAFEERLHFRAIEQATGEQIDAVHILGGGSQSSLWCQILSDVLDRPVRRTLSQEATSLGAAMLAAVAAGHFASAREAAEAMGGTGEEFAPGKNAQRYARLFDDVYAGLYPALRDSLGRLAEFLRTRE